MSFINIVELIYLLWVELSTASLPITDFEKAQEAIMWPDSHDL